MDGPARLLILRARTLSAYPSVVGSPSCASEQAVQHVVLSIASLAWTWGETAVMGAKRLDKAWRATDNAKGARPTHVAPNESAS